MSVTAPNLSDKDLTVHFQDELTNFALFKPTATFVDSQVKGNLNFSTIQVEYNCKQFSGGGLAQLNITLTPKGCWPMTWNWAKQCGMIDIPRRGFTISLSSTGAANVLNNGILANQFSESNKQKYRIAQEVGQITFYAWQVTDPMDMDFSTWIRPPYIISNHQILYPTLSGSLIRGGEVTQTVQDLTITFNCLGDLKKTKVSDVALVVAVPYFQDIEIYMTKVCGPSSPSTQSFRTIGSVPNVLWIVGLLLLFFGVYVIIKNQQGEEVVAMEILPNIWGNLKNVVISQSRKFRKKNEDEELDLDDGGLGLNVKTATYGSI